MRLPQQYIGLHRMLHMSVIRMLNVENVYVIYVNIKCKCKQVIVLSKRI